MGVERKWCKGTMAACKAGKEAGLEHAKQHYNQAEARLRELVQQVDAARPPAEKVQRADKAVKDLRLQCEKTEANMAATKKKIEDLQKQYAQQEASLQESQK